MPEQRAKSRKASAKSQRLAREKQPARKTPSHRWIYVAAAAVVLYVVFQVYAPALSGPFVFDDQYQPYHTPGFPSALGAWVKGVRPLLMLSYWINSQIAQTPAGFHITNVFIHLLNGILIFLLVRKFLGPESNDWMLPGFAAAVFLLHPIQTECVAYIAGRSESLSVFFFLAAFAVFLYRPTPAISWKTTIAVLALFGAAVMTKEHTVVLPALLLLTDYYWNPGFSLSGIRRNWRLYIPVAALAAGGLIFVWKVLASSVTAGFHTPGFTWYQYFFTECRAFFVYLRLLVLPVGQDLDWDYAASHNILDHGAIFALAAVLLLTGLAIYFRRRYPLISYGFLVYLLLLAPTSSFVPIRDPLAERRLYLPMIGILLVVTGALARIHVDRRKLAAAFGVVLLVLSVATYQRNELWGSDIALWEDTALKSPHKQRVIFQLGRLYYDNGRCSDALREYATAAQLQKPDYGLLVDWGLAYDCVDQPDEAIAKFRQAAALEPKAHVYSQIAMVYAKHSEWPQALQALAQAEKIDPNYDMIYDTRGGIKAKNNDFAGAAADYKRAVELNPLNQHAQQMLNVVEQQLKPSQ